MSDSVEARVARGAAWLDEERPGWERKIDLNTLDLGRGCRCVLGQVWWSDGLSGFLAGLHHAIDTGVYTSHFAEDHGFLDTSDSNAAWDALQDAWVSLIKERFDGGALSG